MSGANVDLVRSIYEALAAGDIPGILSCMQPDMVWNQAENHPLADRNPYVGPEAILTGVFAWLGGEWDGFAAQPEEFLDGGETVVVLGRYAGTFKATGKPQNAQMVHVWRLRDGKAAQFQQYTDTLAFGRATGTAWRRSGGWRAEGRTSRPIELLPARPSPPRCATCAARRLSRERR